VADDIETLLLTTADGLALEAEMCVPEDAVGAVVLAHPHPQFGGSMRSLVTSELFRSLPGRQIGVLRFNFRGVEGSEGTHGHGRAEHADVVAAIDALAERTPARPLLTAGWSFGGDVTLSVLDDRLAGWFTVAAPLRILEPHELVAGLDPRPKCLAVPEHDEYRTPDAIRALTADWINTEQHTVAGADHYLVGRTDKVVDLLVAFVTRLQPAPD
jgi:alpha/beta superfamily hydrolase